MIRSLRIIVGLLPLITFNFVMSNQAEITKFHVNAKVQMRYAITNIETKVKNSNNETSNVHFNMYIPKEAFVSNFSMVIKDKTYVAKVDTKENALKIFENSTTTSGIVQSFNDPKFKDGKHVSKYFFSMRKLEGMQIRKVFATNTKIISIKHISRCQQLLTSDALNFKVNTVVIQYCVYFEI
jgi:hypothetical protein